MARNHPLPWVRMRANAVLLSENKLYMKRIAAVSGVCRQTEYADYSTRRAEDELEPFWNRTHLKLLNGLRLRRVL